MKKGNVSHASTARTARVSAIAIARPEFATVRRSTGPAISNGLKSGFCEYIVPPQLYSPECVGPKAVARRDLEQALRATGVKVETSVSLQYGSMKRILMHHPENSEVEYLIRRIQALRNQAGASKPGSDAKDALMQEMSQRLGNARDAFCKLKLPEAVRNEFVSAFIDANAPVPVTQQGWKRLEADIGRAAGHALEVMVNLGEKPDLLDEEVSLLVRDSSQRAYDMTVLIDTERQVYAEARIPHCADRGIGALWDGDLLSPPRTVHHPCPTCITPSTDSLVEVDSALLARVEDGPAPPQPIGSVPERETFEGDNLLVVPAYRQKLFQRLGALAHSVLDASGSKVGLKITGFVAPDMALVVSCVQEQDICIADKPWDDDSKCMLQ